MKNNFTILKITLTAAFLSLLNLVYANSPKLDKYGFPFYDDVVNYVKTRVSPHQHGDNEAFKLAKTTEGWYIYVISYEKDSEKLNNPVLCWSKKEQTYIPFGIERSEDEIASNKAELGVSLRDKDCFEKFPIYGFPLWHMQIIDLYKDSTVLSDEQLYALGKAYSELSLNLLQYPNQYSSLQENSLCFKIPRGENNMNLSQIKEYLRLANLSSETYKKLYQQNPYYETFVGNIYYKYCNENISTILLLWYNQSLKEATKNIPDSLYDVTYINAAKNILASCEKNSILITSGDLDTYPLYYLQLKYHFRTDVLLVAYPLLNTDKYVDAIHRPFLSSEVFPTHFSSEEYKENGSLDILYKDNPLYKKLFKQTGLIGLADSNYISKDQILLLDMISANQWKRAIHFTLYLNEDMGLGIRKHLIRTGAVFTLCKKQNDNSYAFNSPVDTKKTLSFFLNEFKPFEFSTPAASDQSTNRIFLFYCFAFEKLAETFIAEKKPEQAKSILDSCLKWFPYTKLKYTSSTVFLTSNYLKLGEKDKANKIAQIQFKNAEEIYEKTLNDSELNFSSWDLKMREALYTFQELKSYYEKENNIPTEISSSIATAQKKFEEYNKKLEERNNAK